MSEREDALLERVLQQVDHPGLEDPGLDLKGDERLVWREYAELAGLLPTALEPATPPPRVLDGLLATVREEGARSNAAGTVASRVDESRRAAMPVARAARSRSASTWRSLAAVLAVVTIGLAAVTGFLLRERSRQRVTIAELERRFEVAVRRDQVLEHEQAQLAPLRSVVTSAGMRACPLRPWGERPQQPWARAVVYFDGDHHQSYLVARDLEPGRQGARYVLWFLVDGKPVPGGSFQAQQGVPVALSAEEVPDTTRGAFLTLEPNPQAEKPTGPPILYGDGAEEML